MSGFTRRCCTAAAGVAIAIIAVVAPGAVALETAGAAASSACTATTGVTVIVDFTHFPSGRIERGCAPGHPADGLVALHEAGFATAGTVQYGDAFVCRIDSLPSPKQDACAVTPSPTSFWAYWNAGPSDSAWTYSNVGVLDYRPAMGSIEAFAFGNRAQPGIRPPAAMPATPTTQATVPPTSSPPSTTPATPAPSVSAVSAPTVPTTAATAPASAATTVPTGSTVAPSSTRPVTTTSAAGRVTTTTAVVIDRSAAGPSAHSGSGSPLPAILAIVVVGGLAAGAFIVSRTRRRRPA